jgi:hypothetical protein
MLVNKASAARRKLIDYRRMLIRKARKVIDHYREEINLRRLFVD